MKRNLFMNVTMLEIGSKILRFYLSYILFFKDIFNYFNNVKRLRTLKE